METERFEVIDVAAAGDPSRFELHRDGELLSYARYRLGDGTIVVQHVETLARHRGNGFADRLMAGTVEIARQRGRTIVPLCSFAADYLREHPEHAGVLRRDD